MRAIPITTTKKQAKFVDFVARAYGSDSARDAIATWSAHAGFRRDLSLLIVDKDAVVGGALVREIPVRVGQSVVSLADIGFPVSETERGEDIDTLLMSALRENLSERGYGIMRIVGKRFRAHGFVSGQFQHSCEIQHANIDVALPVGWRVREAQSEDTAAIAELYSSTLGTYALAPQCDTDDWRVRLTRDDFAQTLLVYDPTDRLRAYAAVSHSDSAQVHEFAVDDDENAAQVALAMLVQHGCAVDAEALTVNARPDTIFAELTLQRGIPWRRAMPIGSQPLHQVIAIKPIMRALEQDFTKRWQHRPYDTPYTIVAVRSPAGTFSIVPSRDGVRIIVGSEVGEPTHISSDELTRFVLGFERVERVFAKFGGDVSEAALRVLSVLFPYDRI